MLAVIQFLGAIGAFIFGCSILLGAGTVMHEIEAMLVFLIAAVLFAGACITEEVFEAKKELKKMNEEEEV